MQGNIENTIDIASAFRCKLCHKTALDPRQNQCCTLIVCDTCVGPICYFCKKPCTYVKTPFLEHLYKCIKIRCPFKCKVEMTLSLLKSHIAVCLEATMECPFCKDKNIKTALFPEHMGSKHEEECSRLLMEFHRAGNNVKNDLGNSQLKISPFQIGVTGLPRLCKFGRLICGGELGVANKSSGLFGQRPICSVEAGSCGKCMILDKQRLGLQNNCLLNMEGRMCFYDQQKKKVMCGITFTSQFGMAPLACNEINICSSCNLTQQLIAQGVYRAVIIDK